MPQPRIPTASLEAKGSFVNHPERKKAREREPKPTAELRDDPPEHLGDKEKEIWRELVGRLPSGVAFDSDQTAFEVLVCLFLAFRLRQQSRQPHVVGELAAMNKLFVQFGMTPSDRSKVKVSPDCKKDPAEQYFDDDDRPDAGILQ